MMLLSKLTGSGSTADYFRADGSTGGPILYHYGTQKLATKSNGIDVTGHETDTLNVSGIAATTFSGSGASLNSIPNSALITLALTLVV